MKIKILLFVIVLFRVLGEDAFPGSVDSTLVNTNRLNMTGDLSAQMVEGIDRFLMQEIDGAAAQRENYWKRDYSSWDNYEKSVAENRARLKKCIGAIDWNNEKTMVECSSDVDDRTNQPQSMSYSVIPIRWQVLEGVDGEGLLLRPKQRPKAYVVAIPDADQTPEMLAGLQPGIPLESQFARRLAEQRCEVLVPVLIDRNNDFSGNPNVNRMTNQPHREWIYRSSFEMGRHIIGYEVEKVLAAVNYFAAKSDKRNLQKIGIVGYGEGGLIGLYSAALQRDVAATLISGYFAPRERLWEEPIYRNLFGLLLEFGDAEIASLIAPRHLIVEYSPTPLVLAPPPLKDNQSAAPGRISMPVFDSVEREIQRANALIRPLKDAPAVECIAGQGGTPLPFGSDSALLAFLNDLGITIQKLRNSSKAFSWSLKDTSLKERQHRQVKELERYTQRLLNDSERIRNQLTLDRLIGTPEEMIKVLSQNRELFWKEVIGQIQRSSRLLNPRTRLIYNQDKWLGYEVVLDVLPDVFAWGYLLIPKDIKPEERRPVVVCQHGLEGLPESVVNLAGKNESFTPGFGAALADQGFIVYAPHNPYRGHEQFRMLQRKANPIGKSLFSVIIAQHDALLDWLGSLPFVDADRIGFYGISYGGKTAMRVPAVLNRYCLSICSADFNDWVKKNVTVDSPYSYVFSGEWEMPEWNLGNTFNYAEMAALIAPRPFMVERGHYDKVAPDWWVAYEYARVKLIYLKLNIADKTDIEYFDGGHRINGEGSFRFLHKYLQWPETE